MYQLYYTHRSAAMSAHAVLEEIGVPYELCFVDLDVPRSAAFLALNPNGTVPVLTVEATGPGDPYPLYQSGAILLHLAERHPEAGLLPAPGTAERALCQQWLFFIAERLMASYLKHFYPERQSAEPAHHDAIRAAAAEQIAQAWGRIDAALDPGPWLLGERLALCDFFYYTFSVWNEPSHVPLATFPQLARALARLEERPSIQAMRKVQVDGGAAQPA